MTKVDVGTLKGLSYDEGREILENAGYRQEDIGTIDYGVPNYDYATDSYFVLEDEEKGERIHTISFEQFFNKNNEPSNDDGSGDFLMETRWVEL